MVASGVRGSKAVRFIDDYSVILLDMMGTFMFGGDRFSEREDYARTYRGLGGRALADPEVQSVISLVFERAERDYEGPDCEGQRCRPVAEYVAEALGEFGLPPGETRLLDEVFAVHETGRVPERHAEVIRRLGQTHRLGVVSNIWCRSRLCGEELRRAGVADLFERVVFSSDVGVLKPAAPIFELALGHFGEDRSKVVFVGDSLKCDVAGARAAGLAAVWVSKGQEVAAGAPFSPALVIEDLEELLTR